VEALQMKNQKINLSKEAKDEMIAELKNHFDQERDEQLGDLAAGILLDFIIAKLGPAIYHQGVYDSYQYMTERNEDLLGIQIYK
jgi:uncharacterized protein (DUF2164 family)